MRPDDLILTLDAIPDTARALVGGKAAALAALVRLGLDVPPAFVVTTRAYAAARAEVGILRGPVAAAVEGLRAQAPAARWAIARSSAPFEDAADFSAAGQLESFICPLTADGVLVQVLAETDAAGVLFTHGRGPASHPDALVIEATRGLGMHVTAGTVTPDRYAVERESLRILERALTPAPTRTTLDASGAPVDLPAPEGAGRPVLSEAQVMALARAALHIEAHDGAPQDVEWGFQGDRLLLLQARPVTVAAEADDTHPDDAGIWTSGFFEERFPGAVTPLTWSYLFPVFEQVALTEPLGFVGVRAGDRVDLLRRVRGRVYTRMDAFQRLYKFFPRFLLPADARRFFPGGDVSLRRRVREPRLPAFVAHVLHTIMTEGRWHPFNDRVWRRFVPRYHRRLAGYRARLEAADDPSALLELLADLRHTTASLLRIHRWSLIYAEVFSTILNGLVTRWTTLAPEQVQTHLVSTAASPTRRANEALRALAERARDLGATPDALRGTGTLPPDLARRLDAYLAAFGHRSFCLDLSCPREADAPEQVRAAVAALLEAGTAPVAAGRDRADSTRAALWRQVGRWPLGVPRAAFLRLVLAFARRYVPLREEQRFEWQRALHLTRRALIACGAALVKAGRLREADDVFFLHWDELERALLAGDGPSLAGQVAARRRAFRRAQHAPYPRFLRGREPLGVESAPRGRVLTGVPASAGQASGTARVVAQPGSLDDLLRCLHPGDILVTRATDPGWTPAFDTLRALVMNVGGQLSHGAIVAREYGLPAVVAVEGALEHIPDGAPILVDGERGTVTLLDAE